MSIATRLIVNRAGRVFLVLLDAADAALYDASKWHVSQHLPNGEVANVYRRAHGENVILHRVLFGYGPRSQSVQIRHKNGNRLDTRRANLRRVTCGEMTVAPSRAAHP
jgi:hypothetical protein